MSELSEAVKILVKHLKEDEGYRISWKANIAMAIRDEWKRQVNDEGFQCVPDDVRSIANNAADNFLNSLCRDLK